MTLKQFEEQWQALFQRDAAVNHAATARGTSNDDEEDPFDCSDLVIPTTHDLVDAVANEFVQRWQELDERKVLADAPDVSRNSETILGDDDAEEDCDDDEEEKEDETEDTTLIHASFSGRKRRRQVRASRHIRLPEHFDYTTSKHGSTPPPDNGSGDRVVSLDDPTTTLSYHTELWKLFHEIPSNVQLEAKAVAGVGQSLPHTKRLYDEIMEAQTQRDYFKVDGYALSRFRMNDRHDLPPVMYCGDSTKQKTTTCASHDHVCATMRLEFFRQQMYRGSSPDSKRMVLEFLGTQTLLHVHRVLVEFTNDELWERAAAAESETAVTIPTSTSSTERSGFFFIEGVFYTTGSVDYTTPILEWMKSGTKREQTKRLRTHLGLTNFDTLPPVRSMAETRLDDIACRLGLRYVHVMHGDVECTVFVTDRRLLPRTAADRLEFPLIHDIWTSPSNPTLPECGACQRRPGSIATATTCEITGGHCLLCEDCCRQLQLPHKAPDQIKRFSEWKSPADLSTGATTEQWF